MASSGAPSALPQPVFCILVDHFEHDFSVFWIELRPESVLNLFAHAALRHRFAVTAIAAHGVVGVRNGDNPGCRRDVLSRQTLGVSVVRQSPSGGKKMKSSNSMWDIPQGFLRVSRRFP